MGPLFAIYNILDISIDSLYNQIMDNNILSEFTSFIEKSAVAMAQGTLPMTQPSTGQVASRVAVTDEVNNSISPGVSNPSHGGAMGAPKAVTAPGKPLQKAKWNNP